jgi:TonB family protein
MSYVRSLSTRFVWRWMRSAVVAAIFSVAIHPAPARAQVDLERKVRTKVSPEYPELARRLNLHGNVKLLVVVAPDGNLKEAKAVGGNPILVNAAMDAVKKWKFEPAPTESSGTVEFRFQPQQ